MRLDLADRSLTPIQTAVRGYLLSADERYLLWQDSTPTSGGPDSPTGIVSLRDTTSASSVSLGNAQDYIDYSSLDWIARGYIPYRSGHGGRIFRVPALEPIELPSGAYPTTPAPCPRNAGCSSAFDLDDAGVTPLFRDQGQFVAADADNAYTNEGALWRVPLDGTPAQRLTDGASSSTSRSSTSPTARPPPNRRWTGQWRRSPGTRTTTTPSRPARGRATRQQPRSSPSITRPCRRSGRSHLACGCAGESRPGPRPCGA